jgi:hypothetical protein
MIVLGRPTSYALLFGTWKIDLGVYSGEIPISQRQLAQLLKLFGIAPKSVRLSSGSTPKGLHRGSVRGRLRPIPPPYPVTIRNTATSLNNWAFPLRPSATWRHRCATCCGSAGANSAEILACCGVADRGGERVLRSRHSSSPDRTGSH